MEPRDSLWWQQDGAPPHFARVIRELLNDNFVEQWIGRGDPVEWTPRSPDLSPLDFFLWGYLKRKVYSNRPATTEELKKNIIEEYRQITPDTLEKVMANCYRRMLLCKQNNVSTTPY